MAKPDLLQIGPLDAWDQQPLDDAFTVHRYFAAADKPAMLAEIGPKIRAIATRAEFTVDAAIIAACPKLEIVANFGVGYDGVDIAACRARGIKVTNTPEVMTKDVADHAIAMMLAIERGIIGADAWVRDGSWAGKGFCPLGHRVWGRRAGILGLGTIGHHVARRLAGFEIEIAYTSRAPKPDAAGWQFIADPVELARWSDFLFVTTAATPATRHIVGREVLDALGPRGVLINVSRAANVDEDALIAALNAGRLGAAALDVFDGEPNIDPRFLTTPNTLLQPHHAAATVEARRAMGQLMRDNLTAHFAGRPLLSEVI